MTSQEYLAKILRTKTEIISRLEKKMSALTEKNDVIDKIVKENEHRITRTLDLINCHDYRAENVLRALITRIQEDDRALYKLFKKPSGTSLSGMKSLFNFALELAHIGQLFVLKKRKSRGNFKKKSAAEYY